MVVVIMAGGVGSRFWPRSRSKSPKHLLNITSDQSMLQNTINRAEKLTSLENIYVVTAETQVDGVLEHSNILKENIIAEPYGRNTAAAIGLSAINFDDDETMIVLPADHYIRNENRFCEIVNNGISYLDQKGEKLLTIGIEPTHPETGYGYIQLGKESVENIYKVQNFAEKPNYNTAVRFLESGDFIWNSGIFIWRVGSILEQLKRYLPDLYETLTDIKDTIKTPAYDSVVERVYKDIRSISIDYGVMERSEDVMVMRGDFGWSDVGSWYELHKFEDKDGDGNVVVDNFISIDSKNCYIYSDNQKKLITSIGLEGVGIIDTDDALLVADLKRSQDVKELYEKIKAKDLKKYL